VLRGTDVKIGAVTRWSRDSKKSKDERRGKDWEIESKEENKTRIK
jgi:hypothetical protein